MNLNEYGLGHFIFLLIGLNTLLTYFVLSWEIGDKNFSRAVIFLFTLSMSILLLQIILINNGEPFGFFEIIGLNTLLIYFVLSRKIRDKNFSRAVIFLFTLSMSILLLQIILINNGEPFEAEFAKTFLSELFGFCVIGFVLGNFLFFVWILLKIVLAFFKLVKFLLLKILLAFSRLVNFLLRPLLVLVRAISKKHDIEKLTNDHNASRDYDNSHTRGESHGDSVRGEIREKFSDILKIKFGDSVQTIPQMRGSLILAWQDERGIHVGSSAPGISYLCWEIFDEIQILLLKNKVGGIPMGNVMNAGAVLGDQNIPFDSVEGCIAVVRGARKGQSVYRLGGLVANILVWGNLCKRPRGMLKLLDS